MNPISNAIASSILMCFDNIQTSGVITTQCFSDTYTADSVYVQRRITISSRDQKGNTVTTFRVTEKYPDREVMRVNLEGITAVTTTGGVLAVTAGSYSFIIAIEIPEPVQPTA